MRTATQVLPQERSSNIEPQRRERGDGETSALDGERAWAGGVSQAVRDGGVSERLVERAIGGAQVSSTRAAKGAIGAFVGGFGVQHCGLDPAGLASWARVRAGGASGGVAAVRGAKRAGKRPETTVSGPLRRSIRSRGAEVAVSAGAAFGSAELGVRLALPRADATIGFLHGPFRSAPGAATVADSCRICVGIVYRGAYGRIWGNRSARAVYWCVSIWPIHASPRCGRSKPSGSG